MSTQTGSFGDLGFGLERNATSGKLQLGGQGLAGANEVLISERILTASAASITFSSIPDDYDDLLIVVDGRSDDAGVAVGLDMETNGDTTAANYHTQYHIFEDGATHAVSETAVPRIGQVTAAGSGSSDRFSRVTIRIPNYAGTTYRKIAHGHTFDSESDTFNSDVQRAWLWKFTTAITSLRLYPSAGSFVANTKIRLVGVKSGIPAQVGGLTKIQKQTLTGAAATITFSNIPQKYDSLLLVLVARSDKASASFDNPRLYANGDTTAASYDSQYIVANDTSLSGDFQGSAPGIGVCTTSTSPSDHWGHFQIEINEYTSSKEKTGLIRNGFYRGTGAGEQGIQHQFWHWNNTAAITNLQLALPADNYITGTVAILYGIGGADQLLEVENLTANRSLNDNTDVGKTFTNTGATGLVTLTLPTAVANLRYRAAVTDADGIKFLAAAGDTIRIYNQLSAAAGFASSVDIGASLELVALDATQWFAVSGLGTWTVT